MEWSAATTQIVHSNVGAHDQIADDNYCIMILEQGSD